MREKLSVVYDITRLCPWNCKICCMGATSDEKRCADEPSLEEKLQIVENIAEVKQIRDVRIDFSGGEIFTDMGNIKVLEYAAKLLGRGNIGISTSGYKINDVLAQRLSKCVAECEMTMDVVPGHSYVLRPKGYAVAAAKAIPHLQKHGIEVGIQTVLAHSNCNEKMLREIYDWLCLNKVDCWSLLKFYPSGRGAAYMEETLSKEDEKWAVSFITGLGDSNESADKPKIDFHYTMKGHKKSSDECRCVKKSIGVMPNGDVTSCFWAVDADTGIIEPKFRLGNLREERLADILMGEKAAYWLDCDHQCELKAA